jgi:hypothetical protein
MIPSTYQFKDVYGEPGLHPGVTAEIEAARERNGGAQPVRRRVFAAWLQRVMQTRQTRHEWSHVPAE